MSNLKFCPECGEKLEAGDSFCGECGYNIGDLAAKTPGTDDSSKSQITAQNQEKVEGQDSPPIRNYDLDDIPAQTPIKAKNSNSKNRLIIVITLLLVLFLGAGALYWLLSTSEKPNNAKEVTNDTNTVPEAAQADLSQANTYLPESELKCTFTVNYPDGNSGVVDRISAVVVPDQTVTVSEVETGIENGEEFGFGIHYIERADGTYSIADDLPYEAYPVLKNNLAIGQTWDYADEFGGVSWEVLDMGVDLDLGFKTFTDCLLVEENNQAADFNSITYYAPGYGIVYVISPGANTEFYKMTAMTTIDKEEAENAIIKWCNNYLDIKDDRTQSS